ncbi:MAG: 2-dehydro-3-deoxygalactonokinase [Bacteroidia bacterium]|nr:2-dehydro-3-deoxygalactonokinase [Bacteroidia bacterium]
MSCDWGTSSFRLRLVETETAEILYEIHSNEGIKSSFAKFSSEIGKYDEIEKMYKRFLMDKIRLLERKSGATLMHVPIIFSGMASSSIGIRELPYGELPFRFDRVSLPYEWMQAEEFFPYNILLISGLKKEGDVMRGEETQLIGLSKVRDINNSLILMPGTHSKHMLIGTNELLDFKTYMTGEFFELISRHSILSHSIELPEDHHDYLAFRHGVKEGAEGNLLNRLFRVRTNSLFEKLNKKANYYYLSGLIIGSELKEVEALRPERIFLCGEGVIKKLYKEALSKLGYADQLEIVDGDGLNLSVQGHLQILYHLQ